MVRGVVFGHHNMEEEGVLEHPAFRSAMAEIGFAAVWVAPGFDRNFRYDQGAGERFDAMLQALADQSGYAELATAPLVPVGHSAAASTPWYIAAWKPGRVIAGISFSGQWPYVPDEPNAPHVAGVNIDSVPGLVTMGEYEWADQNLSKGLDTRKTHPALPLSALGCPADGHFFATDEKIEFLALYLKKAAAYRLPETNSARPAAGAVALNAIDVTRNGWLAERYRKDRNPSAPAAPVADYKGDPAQAFWFFDGELARAAESFQQKHRGQPALLGYLQDGRVLPQKNGLHAQVSIDFKPAEDGVTFKLAGSFLDTVPEGRPEKWAGKKPANPSLLHPPAARPSRSVASPAPSDGFRPTHGNSPLTAPRSSATAAATKHGSPPSGPATAYLNDRYSRPSSEFQAATRRAHLKRSPSGFAPRCATAPASLSSPPPPTPVCPCVTSCAKAPPRLPETPYA